MVRELPRSLAVSLLVHAGAVALLVFTVRFVSPRPFPPSTTMTAHFLIEDTPEPAVPTPVPPTPEPPTPPPPLPAPSIPAPVAEITPRLDPEPAPAPIQPITTARRDAPAYASHPHRAGATSAAPSAPATGASAGGVTTMAHPRYAVNPAPSYPPEARRLKQQGVTLLHVKVGADGSAQEVTLKHSSGFASLDEAALAAVRRWKFEPARLGGNPVPADVEVPVNFQLKP